MKPCRKYKEQIALAIVDDEVERHVFECAACAAYAEELKRICGEHRERAEALPDVQAPLRLNARVRDAITRGDGCCGVERRASLRRLLQGLGVAGAAAVILALALRPASREPAPAPVIVEVTKPEVGEPTFAAYHNRLARSVEELEASLQHDDVVNGGEILKVSSASENLP